MTFEDAYFSRRDRYALGVESTTGRCYVAIPVSNGIVDYEEYYEVTADQYRLFLDDHGAAAAFAEACRRHEHDGLLIQKPGRNRGTPV